MGRDTRVEPSAARVWAFLRALVRTPPPARHVPHVRLARANSAPARRGVVLALKPATAHAS